MGAVSTFGRGRPKSGSLADIGSLTADFMGSAVSPMSNLTSFNPGWSTPMNRDFLDGPSWGAEFMQAQPSQGWGQNLLGIQPQGAVPNAVYPSGPGGGAVSNVGGAWRALDAHNNEIASTASRTGVPANLLKAMINRESSGNWARDNRVFDGLRGDLMLPFVGIFKAAADSWGLNWNAMVGNKQAQIDGMAHIVNGLAKQYGGYENAAKVYFGGEAALTPEGFTDEYKMNSNIYGSKAIADWRMLDQMAGYTGGYGTGPNPTQPSKPSFSSMMQQYLMKAA